MSTCETYTWCRESHVGPGTIDDHASVPYVMFKYGAAKTFLQLVHWDGDPEPRILLDGYEDVERDGEITIEQLEIAALLADVLKLAFIGVRNAHREGGWPAVADALVAFEKTAYPEEAD